MSLFQELKRRKVVRTTVAYLAGAFVAAQVTELLVEGLELPGWILKAVLIVIVVALPLVIGLAWAFDITPQGVERTAGDPTASRVTLPWRRVAMPATASLLILIASVAFFSLNDAPDPSLNARLVAVMPFRVSGDAQIEYLREGMVDLLAAKLTGEGGPRAADPRAVLSAAKQEAEDADVPDAAATEIARRLGAGRVLVGSVVGTAQRFQISARILSVPGGQVVARGEEAGSADSLLFTVDRLVAKLLSLEAGEGPQRLDVLTTTSLPALRAYLDAQTAYRSGHFGRASELFGRALDHDSTFALAALGQQLASGWGEGPPVNYGRIGRLMYAYRDRLGPVDRALVDATIGERPGTPRTVAQRIDAYRAAVELAPDRADAWFSYGDYMSHWGGVAGYIDFVERSDAAFDRVLALDSSYVPALLHRMDNAHILLQPDEYRRLDQIRRRLDPDGSAAIYQATFRNQILGDAEAIAAERAAIDTMSMGRLIMVSWIGGTAPGAVEHALSALERLVQISRITDAQIGNRWFAADTYLRYGMPSRAARTLDELAGIMDDPLSARIIQVLAALYGSGDGESARRAAAELEKYAGEQHDTPRRNGALCALEQWRLWHKQTQNYRATHAALARVPADSVRGKLYAELCAGVLAAIYATTTEPDSLPASTRALDALLRDGPPVELTLRNAANLVLARAAERAGDRKLAYRAAARIPAHPNGGLFTYTLWREAARLAALNGDRDRAIRGYTFYLLNQEQAEPPLGPEIDAARTHLAQLTAEGR